jgi:hypothetical protein
MTWFKVDDKLPRHRKARAVRRTHPTKARDAAPFGLWVLAGAESEDGFIALEVLLDWDDDALVLAERLVDAKLWWKTEVDGEPGYGFHDWQDYLPRPDGIEDASESGRRGNHVRWHEKRGLVDPECSLCVPTSPRRRGDIAATDRPAVAGRPDGSVAPPLTCGNADPADGEHIGSIAPNRPDAPDLTCENSAADEGPSDRGESRTRPDPTRPDPTRENPSPKRKPTPDEIPGFEEFWQVYDHKTGRAKAEVAYRAALRKAGVTPEVLLAAAGAYVSWQKSEGKHPTYTKHPTTWLNGEHWRDERVGRQRPQTRVQEHLAIAEQLAAEHDQPRALE